MPVTQAGRPVVNGKHGFIVSPRPQLSVKSARLKTSITLTESPTENKELLSTETKAMTSLH
jgi:hypothetical protein